MSQQIALIGVAAGGLIFTDIGIYAVILQADWMNRLLEQNRTTSNERRNETD
jgi:hypothetical protein